MIKKVLIENFQSHEKSELEFHPGVNVITGRSDSGKSAVIRAIRWLLRNRPLGTAYRSDFSKDSTLVTMDFDGENRWVTKVRGGTTNYYLIPGDIKLEALRSDVPDDVSKIAKIHDCSLQGQHDGYFLLQSTSGEVARELNDIVGLDIIDNVFKNIAGLLRKCKSDKEVQEDVIAECDEELKNYIGLDERDKRLGDFEKLLIKRAKDREERRGILSVQNQINEIDSGAKGITSWLEVEGAGKKLSKVIGEWRKEEQLKGRIEDLLHDLKRVESDAADYDDFIGLETRAEQLDGIVEELRKEERGSKILDKRVEELQDLEEQLDDIGPELQELQDEKETLLEEAKVCPFCYGVMDTETIERMEAYTG